MICPLRKLDNTEWESWTMLLWGCPISLSSSQSAKYALSSELSSDLIREIQRMTENDKYQVITSHKIESIEKMYSLSCSSGSMPKGRQCSSSISSGSSCKTQAGFNAVSGGCPSHPSPSLCSSWNNPGDEGSSTSSWNMEFGHGCGHRWRKNPKNSNGYIIG